MPEILHVVGARPNFMKMAPVHRALLDSASITSRIVHTGQHYDRLMSDVFFEDLQLPAPDVSLGVGSGTHAEQTAGIMVAFERLVGAQRPDLVAVYGDVNSTLAAALVCAKMGIPLAHVEAGLRSGDWTMPEEVNRVVTDRLSSLLLTTEPSAHQHLRKEGIPVSRIRHTGNVMIDSLAGLLAREGITARSPQPGRPLVLVTLHRPSNVDASARFDQIARLLEQLADTHELVFPVHPRTRKQLESNPAGARLAGKLQLTAPLRYRDFIGLMTRASLIVTDSGGVQEESAYLGIPCLTLRPNTERPITIDAGTNVLERMVNGDLVGRAREMSRATYPGIGENPVLQAARWDGRAGPRVAAELRALVTG